MKKDIKKIIHSIDVKQDREDAQAKARLILKMGPEVIDTLVVLAEQTVKDDVDANTIKKRLRAIISTLTVLAKDKAFFKKIQNSTAKELLCRLSIQGYKSAELLLNHLGLFEFDIHKILLNSLPIVEKYEDHKAISLDEAIEEIKIARAFSGFKGLKDDCYAIGSEGKISHRIYRIEKKLFALQSKKRA